MNNNVNYVIIISIFISDHKNASGLSIYFPFQLQGSDDLKSFSAVSVNPYYMSIVDKIANGYSANEYDNSVFFSQNGKWVNTDCQCEDLDSAYFGYADKEDEENSKLITFSQKPVVDESGYHFTIDDKGLLYTSEVTAFLYLDLDAAILDLATVSFFQNVDGVETKVLEVGSDGASIPFGAKRSSGNITNYIGDNIYFTRVEVTPKPGVTLAQNYTVSYVNVSDADAEEHALPTVAGGAETLFDDNIIISVTGLSRNDYTVAWKQPGIPHRKTSYLPVKCGFGMPYVVPVEVQSLMRIVLGRRGKASNDASILQLQLGVESTFYYFNVAHI